jgi:hypothetical protein
VRLIRRLDDALVAPGSVHAAACLRVALAAVIGVRAATGPYRALAGQPDALFEPAAPVAWIGSMPPAAIIVALQVAACAAAIACVAGVRPRSSFAASWLGLLLLAGLRGSLGKVLHNDVLLLLAAVPVLFVPGDARPGEHRTDDRAGWPVRGALVVSAVVYFLTGVQKLRHSGLEWVLSDNLRWVLYGGAASGRAPTDVVALAIADRPWLAVTAAAGILAVELGAPVGLAVARLRPAFVTAAVLLHALTWLTLGLDYWGWALTVVAVAAPWDRIGSGLPRARSVRYGPM